MSEQVNRGSSSQQEPVYLMEARNGMLVRVPQSKLEDWKREQSSREAQQLTKEEQLLRDRILQDIYG